MVNETLSQVDIVVRASDYPHGVVEFAQPSAVTTRETGLTLSLPVERHNGLVGDLMLNFYILQSSTATSPEDYVFLNQSESFRILLSGFIVIANKSTTKTFRKLLRNDVSQRYFTTAFLSVFAAKYKAQ